MSNTATGTPQFEALICATVVAYARPFTKSQITDKKRIIPLKDVPPPSSLHNTHSMLLKLRDKVMGHKDATPASGDTKSPNILVLDRDRDGFNLHTIRIGGMETRTRSETQALCGYFVQICEAQLKPLIERHGPEIMKQPIGRYELLVNEPPHP
ncbi:MAG TPA: hypothetical protein VK178_10955 [Opitutaceae bacterium]|nr:hypothetical protein [Opitutaceae bacterium]